MFGLENWLEPSVRGVALSVIALIWAMVLVRVIGLRSFSKMTAFDFVITLAIGSLLATAATVSSWLAFVQSLIAMSTLLLSQFGLAKMRNFSPRFRNALENEPVMLMLDGEFIDEALRRTRVSRADVMAKLRGANATKIASVKAVVLETTGDISVLYGREVDQAILSGIDAFGRAERIAD